MPDLRACGKNNQKTRQHAVTSLTSRGGVGAQWGGVEAMVLPHAGLEQGEVNPYADADNDGDGDDQRSALHGFTRSRRICR